MNAKEKIRYFGLDCLRIVSMCMIVIIHIVNKGLDIEVIHTSYDVLNEYILALVLCAVNIFVLVSSFFLLNDNNIKVGKIVRTCMECWTINFVVSAILFFVGNVTFSKEEIIYVIFPILSRRNWFINVYLLLYVIHPFLNLIIKRLQEKEYKILLFILIMAFSVWPSIMPNRNWTFDVMYGYSIGWFICLYFIMGFIKIYKIQCRIQKLKLVVMYIFLGGGMLFCKIFIEVIGEKLSSSMITNMSNIWYCYDALPVLGMSISIFMLFVKIKEPRSVQIKRTITFLGKSTLGVYIIHDHFKLREILWKSIIPVSDFANNWYIIFLYPMIAICVYIVCSLIYNAISFIIGLFLEDKFCKLKTIKIE